LGQTDSDADGIGDACDTCPFDPADDFDGDGWCADADNCPGQRNPLQEDQDLDGLGDVCDVCPADPLNDPDLDSVCGTLDNCRNAFNPSQQDSDADSVGNACDNCVVVANPGQQDVDVDGRGDACDNCVFSPNPAQGDGDADGFGDACDVCPLDFNPGQEDLDADGEGDVCDFDDGELLFTELGASFVEWQAETVYGSFNLYRGDLLLLPQYTQDPTTSLAAQFCGEPNSFKLDSYLPPVGRVVHYLVTGVADGETGLGVDSSGSLRPHDWPCP
jgi:hypothetical protein